MRWVAHCIPDCWAIIPTVIIDLTGDAFHCRAIVVAWLCFSVGVEW
jgi:hypothetical protein